MTIGGDLDGLSTVKPGNDMSVPQAAMNSRRARGQLRIDALIASAGEVFARKGYEGATMAEIAARSDSCIGSLYQFFRTKEEVAGALIDLQLDVLWRRLDGIAARAGTIATRELADALTGLLVAFRVDHPSFATLIEAPARPLKAVLDLRRQMRDRLEAILVLHAPIADRALLRTLASVVQFTMKSSMQVQTELEEPDREAAVQELALMLGSHLSQRLGG